MYKFSSLPVPLNSCLFRGFFSCVNDLSGCNLSYWRFVVLIICPVNNFSCLRVVVLPKRRFPDDVVSLTVTVYNKQHKKYQLYTIKLLSFDNFHHLTKQNYHSYNQNLKMKINYLTTHKQKSTWTCHKNSKISNYQV